MLPGYISLHVSDVSVCIRVHSSKLRNTKDTRSGSSHKVSLPEISMPVEFNDICVAIVTSPLLLIFKSNIIFEPIVLGETDLYKSARDPHRVKENILNQFSFLCQDFND